MIIISKESNKRKSPNLGNWSSSSRWSQSKFIWPLILTFILVMLPMIIYGPYDQEEWIHSIWSTLQYSSAIWSGKIPPMWSDALGLGTPIPLGHRFDFAPPFLLFPLLSIRWILPLFYTLYLGVATTYVFRLCTDFHFGSIVRLLACITFLLSAPTLQLMYADDWPTLFHNWCLFPVLFFYIRRLYFSSDRTETLRIIFLLGLVGGLWALNGHSGHMAVLASILLVYVTVLSFKRMDLLFKLAGSVFIATLISAEHMYYLISETLKFPKDLLRAQVQDGISLIAFAKTLFRPFDSFLIQFSKQSFWVADTKDWINILWSSYKADYSMRTPFMGTLFIAASIVWSINQIRTKKLQKDDIQDQNAVAITFLFSLTMIFTKASWLLNIPSATWMYREGIVFFGMLAAGRWLQVHLNEGTRFAPWLPLFLSLHMLQMITGSYPVFHNTITADGMNYYENFNKKEGLPGWILNNTNLKESRIFTTSAFSVGYRFVDDGLYGVTDLTFLGLKPFNTLFKCVSMDTVAQSRYLAWGYIPGNHDILTNKSMLDVFGINMVLALDTEPVENLELIAERQSKYVEIVEHGHRSQFKSTPQKVRLYRNNSAWPQAFMMNPVITDINEGQRSCNYSGAVCRDYRHWKKYLLGDSAIIDGKDGNYKINVTPSKTERLLVVSKLFRPEWVALNSNSKNLLPIKKVGGTLLGIHVPPNAEEISLNFRPLTRQILWVLSVISLTVVVLITLIGIYFRKIGR